MGLEGYLGSKEELFEDGYVEIETTVDLLSFFNYYGGYRRATGAVTKWLIGGLFTKCDVYLSVELDIPHPTLGALVFYREDIARRAKKRIDIGNNNRPPAQPVG